MNKLQWANSAIFYHIYPLGLLDAPLQQTEKDTIHRLHDLQDWVPHIAQLGCNALYLGPVFDSGSHGYDTHDYFKVDRRLGDHHSLKSFINHCHDHGIRVILDGVFHHVGRGFWAFQDLLHHQQNSDFKHWFMNVNFDQSNHFHDPFTYDGWNGIIDLVKLNLQNPDVQNHLLSAVDFWVEEYGIDGLRLDAADYIDPAFLRLLSSHCRQFGDAFWLLGEVIHGDYRDWANEEMLDATTNYECYKGLYSSFNDGNMHEIAYSLKRLFGESGIYRHLNLYNFADNHDVDRVASTLENERHLYPLYALLFTMPGSPSIYYGSEWGWHGKKYQGNDAPLRPPIDLSSVEMHAAHPDLAQAIQQFSAIRKREETLQLGTYEELQVTVEQIAFRRKWQEDELIVIVNASDQAISLNIPQISGKYLDLLTQDVVYIKDKILVPGCWTNILKRV